LALSIEKALEEVVTKQAALRNQLSTSQNGSMTKKSQDTTAVRQKFILLLSVSGGCDSVALLHATMELQNALLSASSSPSFPNDKTTTTSKNDVWELECHVMHFHHRQRDVDADLDCQLVQELAEQEYGIPFVLQDWNEEMELQNMNNKKEEEGDPSNKFSQDRARQWRRQRLLEYTQSLLEESEEVATTTTTATEEDDNAPIGIILTAHHRDDSEESLLLKLLRGVHVLNLSGMEAITTLDYGGQANGGGGDHDDSDGARASKIYILRPWLKHRKADLQDYLLSHNKTWREDASNSSPKYLRNRVRNELLPLLEELSPKIHKRLENLEQQSFELQQDLEPRILAHLLERTCQIVVVDGGNQQEEVQSQYNWDYDTDDSDEDDGASPLVQSQALFRWMQQEMERRHRHELSSKDNGNPSPSVSYEMLQRVLEQLRNHPNQLDWTMDLGGKYSLQRKGSRLKILGMNSELQDSKSEIPWTWSIMATTIKDETSAAGSENSALTLAIPAEMITSDLQFVESTVEEYAKMPNALLRFRPPWKPRTGSPIKLRQFLRGQQVPLHERDTTPLLLLCMMKTSQLDDDDDNMMTTIVAVQVKGSWIVHADYQQEDIKTSESGGILLHVERI